MQGAPSFSQKKMRLMILARLLSDRFDGLGRISSAGEPSIPSEGCWPCLYVQVPAGIRGYWGGPRASRLYLSRPCILLEAAATTRHLSCRPLLPAVVVPTARTFAASPTHGLRHARAPRLLGPLWWPPIRVWNVPALQQARFVRPRVGWGWDRGFG